MILNKFLQPKEVVMTREEFINYYDRKYINKEVDLDKRLIFTVTFVIANVLCIQQVNAKSVIDEAGLFVVENIQSLAYWAFLIAWMVETIRGVMNRNDDIVKIAVKYILALLMCLAGPWLFSSIKAVAEQW